MVKYAEYLREYSTLKQENSTHTIRKGSNIMKVLSKTIPIVSLKMVREGGIKRTVSSKTDVTEIVRPFLYMSAIEKVIIVGLDIRNNPTVIHITTGDTSSCLAAISATMKILLLSNSSSFIMVHNHPGDSMDASPADWKTVKNMKAAGNTLELTMLDSIIYNSDMSESLPMRACVSWGSY
jgi:DNA repair protein RadC